MVLPWALTAAAMFATLFWLPLAKVSRLGVERGMRLGELGEAIRGQGMGLLGWFVDLCVLFAPSGLLAGLAVCSISVLAGRAPPGGRFWIALVEWSRRWSMPEVLVLAILVAFLKIGRLARAEFGAGFATLMLGVCALILATQAFDAREVRRLLRPGRPASAHGAGSMQTPLALLIAAALALVPANALPIMEVSSAGKESAHTIFGGVVALAKDGMWAIAAIVFTASFLVPLGKLGGLAWLLARARRSAGTARCVRLHALLDVIGRWSMLDILLIGVLCGLIQFGVLAHVRPGPAAPAFAAAIVLTVFAVESFPLRRLFTAPAPTPLSHGNSNA